MQDGRADKSIRVRRMHRETSVHGYTDVFTEWTNNVIINGTHTLQQVVQEFHPKFPNNVWQIILRTQGRVLGDTLWTRHDEDENTLNPPDDLDADAFLNSDDFYDRIGPSDELEIRLLYEQPFGPIQDWTCRPASGPAEVSVLLRKLQNISEQQITT